jgi:DNA-binding response OmpR family regulator
MPRDDRYLLIADDDAELCEVLEAPLKEAGFAVVRAGFSAEAERLATDPDNIFAALILDVGLPDGDGSELCAQLRRRGVKVPIIMLTGADPETEAVRGLESGANDYIRKPFRMAELLARAHSQLRLFADTEDASFTIGPYTFRPAARLLQEPRRNRRIRLTSKEVAILKFLYRTGDHPANRHELLTEVWGYNASVSTHTLETHIYRLRQKIEADPANPRLLVTGEGGYGLDLRAMTTAA